jgi:hypothetical protein
MTVRRSRGSGRRELLPAARIVRPPRPFDYPSPQRPHKLGFRQDAEFARAVRCAWARTADLRLTRGGLPNQGGWRAG